MRADEASATARLIAAATVLCACSGMTSGLVAPGAAGWCEEFLSTSRTGRWMQASCRWVPGRVAWRLVERAVQPGIVRHWMMRKRWIESRVRAAIADRASQVVVIGAGYDTLGVRLAEEMPAIRIVEIDHPATLAAKRPVVERTLGRERIVLAEADLAGGNVRWLLPPGAIDRDLVTVFVAEGLLMYLPESRVEALLGELATATEEPARLIFSFMVARPDGRIGFEPRSPLVSGWLAAKDERFLWALDPARSIEFSRKLGWEVIGRADSIVLGDLCGVDGSAHTISRGEVVVEAIAVPRGEGAQGEGYST